MADGVTTQDATLATIPTATKIATDDAGAAGHVQLVKLAQSTNGDASPITADSLGLEVQVTNAPLTVTGSLSAAVDSHTSTVVSTGLTTAATPYSIGDQLGAIMQLTAMAATSGGHGYIASLTLLSDTAPISITTPNLGPIEAWFFTESVTLAADNAAFSLSDADAAKCIGVRTFAAPSGAANNEIATLAGVNLDYECSATSVFVALKTLAAIAVFTAADDLHLTARTVRF